MSYSNGPPKIVTDGLVLMLDPIISKSYPGSGNTIYDLSGRGNNGTINGATYWSDGRGCFYFDGTDDYFTLPQNLLIPHTGNPFTFSVWFKTSSAGIIIGQQNTNTPNNAGGYVPGIYVGSNGLLYTSCFWGGSTSNISPSSVSVNNNIWTNISVVFQSNQQFSYLNGELYATLSKTQSSYASIYYYYLGTGRGVSWTSFPASPYFNGQMTHLLHYNKALSANEVSQNYNATKYRFGL